MKAQILAILRGLTAREREEIVRELREVIQIISKPRLKPMRMVRPAPALQWSKN